MTIGAPNLDAADAGHGVCTPSCAFSPAAINQRMVSSPVNGTVIRWGLNVTSFNTSARLRVIRPMGTSALFVGSSATESGLTTGGHTFPTSVSISIGDRIAVEPFVGSVGSVGDSFPLFGAAWEIYNPAPPDGSNGPLFASGFGHYFLVNAEIEASNVITVASTKATKKGTAIVTVHVPNAGTLAAANASAVSASARLAVAKSLILPVTQTVAAPGDVKLTLKPTNATKKRLKEKSKAKGRVTLTYAPNLGTARAQTIKAKLKLKQNGKK